MTDDLIAFLRARLNEVEQMAYAAAESARTGVWIAGAEGSVLGVGSDMHLRGAVLSMDDIGPHIAHWDPARALAEVKAKRRLLNLHAPKPMWVSQDACTECSGCGCCPQEHPCPTVQILALPFADHPEYREEWRPAAE